MTESPKKLLLLIYMEKPDDLMPVVQSENWYTLKDLFNKTQTTFNKDWNGNYVLDQDEVPWKVSDEELASLEKTQGRVIVISDGKYYITGELMLYRDRDGSTYVMEGNVEKYFA
jgi:hypothetical protein